MLSRLLPVKALAVSVDLWQKSMTVCLDRQICSRWRMSGHHTTIPMNLSSMLVSLETLETSLQKNKEVRDRDGLRHDGVNVLALNGHSIFFEFPQPWLEGKVVPSKCLFT